MTLAQAFGYFTREACLNLIRGWKVSVLAVLTIAVSLFVTGTFLLLSGNLHRMVDRWRAESKVVVYLVPGADAEAVDQLRRRVAEAPWVESVDVVDAASSRRRFTESFPSMADLLDGWGEEPLPSSLELQVARSSVDPSRLDSWLSELREDPAVDMIDDDRDWVGRLEAVVLLFRALALVLGAILLGTAVFTIASIIRLTAYLYRDEIAVMRLVGATEFFIRGPFYLEGLLQGLAGGGLAVGGLLAAHALVDNPAGSSPLAAALVSHFLPPAATVALVLLGATAGLVGAVASLRKETLGSGVDLEGGWAAE